MLISEDYKAQQRKMHNDMPHYGTSSNQHAPAVSQLIDKCEIDELLDYGCGKGLLAQSIRPNKRVSIIQYDPGIEGIDETPEPCEMVVCTDVLEHIEPELLDNVLDDLKRVTMRIGYFAIHTGKAAKTLPDGRNAHLIQEPPRWWLPKIMERFELIGFQCIPNGFTVIVSRLQ